MSLEELYFGSTSVRLRVTPGVAIPFVSGHTVREGVPTASLPAIGCSDAPLTALGEEYKSVVVPALPCVPLALNLESVGDVTLPPSLSQPLVKAEDGDIQGKQSGRRSALLCDGKNWYRLKGCGDLYLGFPVIPVDGTKFTQIRGCTFEHTCSREQYITSVVNELLTPFNLVGANTPIGCFLNSPSLIFQRLVGISSSWASFTKN